MNKYSDLSSYAKSENAKRNYEKWKESAINDNGFFIIFNGFVESKILKNINGNALKLYIFFGVHSKNSTGESFYSIKEIAAYFNKSERTISNWIKELEKMHLIERYQLAYDEVAHTYLQPYNAGKKRKNIDN